MFPLLLWFAIGMLIVVRGALGYPFGKTDALIVLVGLACSFYLISEA